jgi:ribose transport system permease protein
MFELQADSRPRETSPRRTVTLRGEKGRRLLAAYGILLVWLGLIVVFGILRPDSFLTTANLQSILGSQAVLLILSLGLLLPLSAGEFDLSVAGTMGIALILVGSLNGVHGWPLLPAILIALAAGLLVGLVNAFFVVKVGIDSIVVTLGSGTILTGIGYGIMLGPVSGVSNVLVDASRTEFLGLPLTFYYALGLTVLLWYVFSFTPLGRYLYFVGGGREAARLAGIPVDLIRAGSLVGAALISAIAGIVLAGTLGGAAPNVAGQSLLPAFTVVFLGATAVTPGRVNPWGAFVAVYFLITGITGLEALGIVDWVEQVYYGAALILALALVKWLTRTGAIDPATSTAGHIEQEQGQQVTS